MVAKILYAQMKAVQGQQEFVAQALTKMAENVRQEPGNVRFEVFTLPDGTFHVEETYKDEAAFQAHMGTQHGKDFNASIVDKVEGGASTVVFLTPVSTTQA